MTTSKPGISPKIRTVRLQSAIKRLRRFLEKSGQSLIVTSPRSQRFAKYGRYAIRDEEGYIIPKIDIESRLRSYGVMTDDEKIERPPTWGFHLARELDDGSFVALPGEYPSMAAARMAAVGMTDAALVVVRRAKDQGGDA